MNTHRRNSALKKLEIAVHVLNSGGTYAAAAAKAGFQNAWHLWGRMHHFGLTGGRPEPK
jgi:transposase-like protein